MVVESLHDHLVLDEGKISDLTSTASENLMSVLWSRVMQRPSLPEVRKRYWQVLGQNPLLHITYALLSTDYERADLLL